MTDLYVNPIAVNQIPVYFPWLADLLQPALFRTGLPRSLKTLRRDLMTGQMAAASVHFPHGAGVIVFSMEREGSNLFCWIYALAGQVKLRYRAFKARLIEILVLIEAEAKKAGCSEMRFRGRNWSWLPGYESMGDDRLRKVL